MRLKTIYFAKINIDYWLPTDTSKQIIKFYKLKNNNRKRKSLWFISDT